MNAARRVGKMIKVRFSSLQLRNKLLISYGSLIIFSVSLVGFLSYNNIQGYIFEQTSESYSQTLEQVVMNIDYKLNTFQDLLNPYISDHAFIAALTKNYSSPADYSFQYLETLRKIFELESRYATIKDVIVYKNNDTLPEIGMLPPDDALPSAGNTVIDISNAAHTWWFQQYYRDFENIKLQRLLELSKMILWTTDDNYSAVSIIKPIVSYNEKIVGIVELRLRFEDIFNEYLTAHSAANDHFYIEDGHGRLIFNSKPEHPVSALPNEQVLEEIAANAAGKILLENSKPERLLVYRTNESTGWRYMREIPMQSLLLSAKSIRDFTIVILLVSILISFMIALAIARVLTRRISLLTNHMEQVGDLTLDVKVAIDGRDEIGKLTTSYNRMIRRIRELVEQLKTSQQQQKESEIKSLQAQINPHFLYNTLATINWMAADNESRKISLMVENLAIFYRLALNKGKEILKIADEINHVKAYLEIQKIRLEDKIDIAYDIDPAILPLATLKLILQPFVENSILHGAEHKKGSTHIHIKGYIAEGSVVFEIIDDGVGMATSPANPFVNHGGYGIHNVHEKIQLQYGHRYGVKLYSKPGEGTRVVICIPVVPDFV